jgi:hypothetical protein
VLWEFNDGKEAAWRLATAAREGAPRDSVRFKAGNIFQAGPGVLASPTNCLCDLNGGLDLQLHTMFPFLQDRLQGYITSRASKRLPVGTTAWVETGDKAHPIIIFSPTFRRPLTAELRCYQFVSLSSHPYSAADGASRKERSSKIQNVSRLPDLFAGSVILQIRSWGARPSGRLCTQR